MMTTKKKFLIGGTLVATLGLVIGLSVGIPLSQRTNALKKAREILDMYPLIDGYANIESNFSRKDQELNVLNSKRHNDLAHVIRTSFRNQFNSFDLTKNMTGKSHTDLVRAKEGKLGGQFWAVYASCTSSGKDALRVHMEQAEIIKRFVSMHPEHLTFTTTAQGRVIVTKFFRNNFRHFYCFHKSQRFEMLSRTRKSPACSAWKVAMPSIRRFQY